MLSPEALSRRDIAHYELAEASLLADTPAMAPPQRIAMDLRWEELRQHLETRLYGLRSWRNSWWSHWARLAQNILPRRYHFLITPNSMTRGGEINEWIIDPTGTQALRICSAGMLNGLASPSDPWFKLRVGPAGAEIPYDVQQWLDIVESRLYIVMASSNFYQGLAQLFEDLPVFGTAPMIIYEHPKNIIQCYNPCAGEYYLGAGSDLSVNTFYRTFVLTVSQTVEMFGLERCSTQVQGLWAQKGAQLETEVIIAHAIEPNFDASSWGTEKKLGMIAGGFAYREYYWEWGMATLGPLSVKGFRERPFIAPRWATTSNDAYGRSPGMDALPDIMQLQVMTRRLAEAIEKMVRPPIQADAKLKNQPSSTLPGKITYVDNVQTGGMKSIYDVDPKVQEMVGMITAIQKRIEKWFFNDIFMAISQMEGVQPRNEFEIAERKAERLQVLGPVIEKFYNEAGSNAIRRVYAIMERRGLIPPKPDSLRNQAIEIDYISKLALAQRAGATAAMERGMQVAVQVSQYFPNTPATDLIDPDLYVRQYFERIGFPSKSLKANDQVKADRAARAQQQKQQQALQTAATAAPAAADAAGAAQSLAATDTGQGISALQMMLGNSGGAPLQ